MNRPNDRRGYLTASKLIDGIEPSKIPRESSTGFAEFA